jgi:hypothetical protein
MTGGAPLPVSLSLQGPPTGGRCSGRRCRRSPHARGGPTPLPRVEAPRDLGRDGPPLEQRTSRNHGWRDPRNAFAGRLRHPDIGASCVRIGGPAAIDNRWRRRSVVNIVIHRATISNIPAPPMAAAPTAPIHAARTPDSNSPSCQDVLMKTASTEFTRPRISSGVSIWTSAPRITMLTISHAPSATSEASDSQKVTDTATPCSSLASSSPARAW